MTLAEINDTEKLRGWVERLWQLLDNVDTFDDAARSNDSTYRKWSQKEVVKRFLILGSDGYNLFEAGTVPDDWRVPEVPNP